MTIIETNWSWRSVLKARSTTNLIVLHHAAAVSCTAQQVDSWHKNNGWSGIGYHFFITKTGDIYRGRPLWAVGAHASGSNNSSVGICVEGNYETETTMPYPQKAAVKELLSYLREIYPNADIKGHKETGATGCPGNFYPLNEMKAYFAESEDLTVAQYEELKAKDFAQDKIINTVGQEIEELKGKTKYYNSVSEVPQWYRATVNKLVADGTLEGDENGNLNLSLDMMRILTILDRQGLFG